MSIAIDVTRSRALMRAAKKHNSQALEADALHFSTDVWSSSVVIAGLVAVSLGQWLHDHSPVQADWLFRADAVAALGVSVIVIWVSVQLGRRTVDVLLDSAPRGMTAQIEQAVAQVAGVSAVQRIRVRQSGPATFVDMTLAVPRSASLEEAHEIAERAEATVQQLYPRADVMVHIDPVVQDDTQPGRARAERRRAAGRGRPWHPRPRRARPPEPGDARGGARRLDAGPGARPRDGLRAGAARGVARAERRRHAHRAGRRQRSAPPGCPRRLRAGAEAVVQLPDQLPGVKDCHRISIYQDGNDLSVSFHAPWSPICRSATRTS